MSYLLKHIELSTLNLHAPAGHEANKFIGLTPSTVRAVTCKCGQNHPIRRGIKVNWQRKYLPFQELIAQFEVTPGTL